MNTQAVVITQPGQVALQEVQLHTPGPDDVIVQTAYTSISAGTERMLFAGVMPHPMLQLPVVPGYETVGQVVEVGQNVSSDWLGRWVYIGGAQCYDSVNAAWGGQSAKLFTDHKRLVDLEGVQPQHGVMLALAATSLHGLDLVNLKPEDRVLVIGQGPVGQLTARIAMSQGAWVAVSDPNGVRLRLSEGNAIINVDQTPITEAIDKPVKTIIEASGSMKALTEALPLLENGGTIVLLGYYSNLELPYMPLFLKEAKLLTAREWAPGDLDRCRDMIADGSLNVEPLLTHRLPITEVSAAYDVALNDRNCVKIILNWNDA